MGVNDLLKKVLESISLSEEEFKNLASKAKELVVFLKKIGFDASIGGSLAKKTLIKKPNQDVDIFVYTDDKGVEKIFKKSIGKFDNVEIVHGSRDYLKIKKDNIYFEIIPVRKLKKNEEASNITDFSLMHVKYIKDILDKNRSLSDEIKLAKAFCVAQNCYGAESYIGGFSGYALEVLVCYHGGFVKFLKNIMKEKIIDPKKYFKKKTDVLRELNESKLGSPIILVDPTYKYRNVCAGLTFEAFEVFVDSAKEFLKKPSLDFFIKKEFNLESFLEIAKKENLVVYEIKLNTDRQNGDVAGTKMKKFFKFLIREINRKEQSVLHSDFVYSGDKSALGYLAIKEKNEIKIIGPLKDRYEDAKKFKRVRKKWFISDGCVCASEQFDLKYFFNKQLYVAESMGVSFLFEKLL